MQSLNTLFFTHQVIDWLARTRQPRVLHVFDGACNLINEYREVISIVAPGIGNGPFNLVLERAPCFSDHITLESVLSPSSDHLSIGTLVINTADARLWSARPDWDALHTRKAEIAKCLTQLQSTNHLSGNIEAPIATTLTGSLQSLVPNFSSSLAKADICSAMKIASHLAGLGIGLTPAGDDFMMGAMYAAWIIHPFEEVRPLARKIADTAAPLTTSLSAEWLKYTGRGEVGVWWHEFFDALLSGDLPAMRKTVENILAIGETSGADALAGFQNTMRSWAELYPAKLR
jgi:hypothetical protein